MISLTEIAYRCYITLLHKYVPAHMLVHMILVMQASNISNFISIINNLYMLYLFTIHIFIAIFYTILFFIKIQAFMLTAYLCFVCVVVVQQRQVSGQLWVSHEIAVCSCVSHHRSHIAVV